MKVGDLVKFFSNESDYAGQIGIVMGLSHCKVYGTQIYVQWPSAYIRYSARQLEMISESR
jgi:hypothetical protein